MANMELKFDNDDIDRLIKEIKKYNVRKRNAETVLFAIKTIKSLRNLDLKY